MDECTDNWPLTFKIPSFFFFNLVVNILKSFPIDNLRIVAKVHGNKLSNMTIQEMRDSRRIKISRDVIKTSSKGILTLFPASGEEFPTRGQQSVGNNILPTYNLPTLRVENILIPDMFISDVNLYVGNEFSQCPYVQRRETLSPTCHVQRIPDVGYVENSFSYVFFL